LKERSKEATAENFVFGDDSQVFCQKRVFGLSKFFEIQKLFYKKVFGGVWGEAPKERNTT